MERSEFKERLKQYKKAREENPGLKYWEWKAQPAEKEVPKYEEGTGNVYYAGMLPEVVVVPEKWQKDFSENFGDARIRRNVYRNMPLYTKQEDLLEARKKYYELQRLGQFTEDSRKAFENKLDSLSNDYSTFVEDPNTPYRNVNNEIKRLYDVWNAANRPEITSKNSIFGDMFGFETPHWNPVNNSIRNTANLRTIISELAHPIQYKVGDKNRLVDYLLGLPKAVYGHFSKYYNAYGDKNHYEYDTHHNIEPALREYISHGKNTKYLNQLAEGGEVTGPPTYDDWYTDITTPKLNAFDDAYLHVNINDAAADLHNIAMTLPGYANKWNEYQRSRPKEDPSIDAFVNDLWANENPNNVGYRNGKYYPHKSPEGGKMTIGPGFKLDSGSHGISTKTANRGMTKTRLNQEARKIGKQHLAAVDQFLNYGQTTNPADTVSPQIKMGLMDLRHQVGPLNEWSNLRQAVLEGDLDRIKKESTVTWNDNGKIKVDKRRKKIRDEKYFYYE